METGLADFDDAFSGTNGRRRVDGADFGWDKLLKLAWNRQERVIMQNLR